MAGPEHTARRPPILPPKGLLLALLLQAPLAIRGWPWRPSIVQAATGGALLVAGSLLNLWAARRFTRNAVGICPFSPVPRLVEDGPYRWSRNPMYLGMVLIAASVSLLTACPWNLWTALAYGTWLHVTFILPEERFLRECFGEAFEAYAKGRGRWLGPL